MDSDAPDKTKPGKSLSHQLAQACLASPVMVFVLLMFGKSVVPRAMLELSALCLIVFGLITGIIALFGIKKHGKKKILSHSLIGLAASGLLLAIFVTNFLNAREKAIQQNLEFTGSPDGKTIVTSSLKTFQGDGFVFQYDEHYQADQSASTGQIFLKHPLSSVVITDHRQKLDPEETLQKFITALKADFSSQHYKDISATDAQPLFLKNFNAFKAGLAYTRPVDSRVMADIYVLATPTTTYSFMHYYPEKTSAAANKLFETFLSSFTESPTGTSKIGTPEQN